MAIKNERRQKRRRIVKVNKRKYKGYLNWMKETTKDRVLTKGSKSKWKKDKVKVNKRKDKGYLNWMKENTKDI